MNLSDPNVVRDLLNQPGPLEQLRRDTAGAWGRPKWPLPGDRLQIPVVRELVAVRDKLEDLATQAIACTEVTVTFGRGAIVEKVDYQPSDPDHLRTIQEMLRMVDQQIQQQVMLPLPSALANVTGTTGGSGLTLADMQRAYQLLIRPPDPDPPDLVLNGKPYCLDRFKPQCPLCGVQLHSNRRVDLHAAEFVHGAAHLLVDDVVQVRGGRHVVQRRLSTWIEQLHDGTRCGVCFEAFPPIEDPIERTNPDTGATVQACSRACATSWAMATDMRKPPPGAYLQRAKAYDANLDALVNNKQTLRAGGVTDSERVGAFSMAKLEWDVEPLHDPWGDAA